MMRQQHRPGMNIMPTPYTAMSNYVEYSPLTMTWTLLSVASTAACAYHGYKRNNSIGWAIGWGILGGLFFPITPAIALAEGFGKPRK